VIVTPRTVLTRKRSAPGIPYSLGLVQRRRLVELLDRGVRGPVTRVSGPAGSGKTVLVASWLRKGVWPGRMSWVSVEPSTTDAVAFWSAVVEALHTSGATTGVAALESLTPSPRGVGREFVRRLGAGLRELSLPVLLIVDDLHELDAPEAVEGFASLLADLPQQLRIVLITRRELRLGLHRLRAAGELMEIRAADLPFTLDEARELLAKAGVQVSERGLVSLWERTEGWAAGLRLAAMSLAGRRDPDRFIAEFSGGERTVAEYLGTEVLASQPAEVRRVLLRTSLLRHVNAPLVRLLTGRHDGERLLQELEDQNAFVASVDVGRGWFRYHPLLLDLLSLELRRESPEEIDGLHRSAARWHAEHGSAVEAIRHAEAAKDWSFASDLLAEHWFSLFLDGQQATIRGLLEALPVKLMRSDAELVALVAADRLAAGRLEAADGYLAEAECLAESVPKPRRRRFEVTLAVVKLTRARSRGDLEATVESARAILTPAAGESRADVVSNEDLRVLALMNLGIVELWALRLEDADRHLEEGFELAKEIGRPYVALGCLGAWAHVATFLVQRPEVTEARSREAIELAGRHGWSDDPLVGVAYLALGGPLLEGARLDECDTCLNRAAQVLQGQPGLEARLTLPFCRGALRFGQGRYDEALRFFREAERGHEALLAPHYLATAVRTWPLRAHIRLGDTGHVHRALIEAGEAGRSRPEWCNLAAELHLAEDHPGAALEALAPVLDGSATGFHVTFEIEALLWEAVARDLLGEAPAAEDALERALELAEDGHLWIVLAIPAVQPLLERHRTAHGSFMATLLDRFAAVGRHDLDAEGVQRREALTDRERTVLGFLPTNLSAPEIAREMSLSVHTVKMHIRHIYSKLDVQRRSDAVERARELRLLGG
jgi:LuxR family transcriptional regulator, maltose regulon positive regulatory protein